MFFARRAGDKCFSRGDILSADFDETGLVADGAYHNLDLSSIIPAGTKRVYLGVVVQDGLINQLIQLKKGGYVNEGNKVVIRTIVTAQNAQNYFWIDVDANRVIQYWLSNTTWTSVLVTVLKWVR